MIQNDRQYKITLKALRDLREAYDMQNTNDLEDWVVKANRDALVSQIEEFEELLASYELLKSGSQTKWSCSGLEYLPTILIKARISSGKTQKELAAELDIKPQQVQRYEATNYQGANLDRLIEVANALNIEFTSIAKNNADDFSSVISTANKMEWGNFPIKEMIRRKWIENIGGISTFFNSYPMSTQALHRKSYHGTNRPNEYSLLAWQTKVLYKAQEKIKAQEVNEFVLSDRWVKELVSFSALPDAPIRAVDLLRKNGIVLVFERHLSKTYLDGAAMLTKEGIPVVGMTLRHDRLDNFWFVLLHELGHIFLHLFNGSSGVFFDDVEGGVDTNFKEQEADKFALDNLISEKNWLLCVSRFQATSEAVIADSKRLNVHPSIVAGRVRKEKNNYTLLNEFVGSGMVRKTLGEDV